MGLNPKCLPDKLLRLMPRESRAPLGKAGMTNAEAQAKADTRAERELQTDMVNLLNQRNLFFDTLRMDKRTRSRPGRPDFYIFLPTGKALLVEAKVQGGELTEDQKRVFTEYWDKTGQVVHIILNLDQFKTLLDTNNV